MPSPGRLLRRPRARLLMPAVVVLAAVVVGLAGGYGAVPRRDLPVLRPGGTYDNGVYAVTVRSWSVRDADPVTGRPLLQPQIVADVVLRYRGDEPARRAGDWLRPLDLGIPAGTATLRSARDGSYAPPVQPGLPLHVLYLWEVPAGSGLAPGDDLRLGVFERYEAADVPIEGVTTVPVLVGTFEAAS